MALRLDRSGPPRRPAPCRTHPSTWVQRPRRLPLTAPRRPSIMRLGCGVLVSLGGDASAAGPAPAGGFAIGIADACTSPTSAEAVAISSGGLASSGIGVRQWRLGSHQVHHIVDPATGLSAAPCWRTVSTTAATCVQANAASTAADRAGRARRGLAGRPRTPVPARAARRDGRLHRRLADPRTRSASCRSRAPR